MKYGEGQFQKIQSPKRKFAVFDIDGTLIRWQLYHAVVDRLAKRGLLGPDAHKKLHDARMVWKRREHQDAFKWYEHQLIGVYEQALPNLSVSLFDQIVEEIVQEYKEQVYVFTRGLVSNFKKRGYFLIAISGSHRELIEHVAKLYDFDAWIGSEYKREGDHFTGQKFVASIDKKTVLLNLIEKYNLSVKESFAIGDSESDTSMLEEVEHPIAFNPDKNLFNFARGKHWDVVLERKNMVYKLVWKEDKYELASSV